jgi:hypothetical protein
MRLSYLDKIQERPIAPRPKVRLANDAAGS